MAASCAASCTFSIADVNTPAAAMSREPPPLAGLALGFSFGQQNAGVPTAEREIDPTPPGSATWKGGKKASRRLGNVTRSHILTGGAVVRIVPFFLAKVETHYHR